MTISTPTKFLPQTQFYTWKSYRCAYEIHIPNHSVADSIPLLTIHPIGVGLSRNFWHRFCHEWIQKGQSNPIYNPDLLGCGESDMPRVAYTPTDWAEQLQYFLQTVVKKPVILVVQGALLPVALCLVQLQSDLIRGIVLSGPPAWAVITKDASPWQQKVSWNLFDSPLGQAFYRYASRRQFLQSFSNRQLFANINDIDDEWLDTLKQGSTNPASRHGVFSFLAGFWRQDYTRAIAQITQPTLVVLGEKASSISREGQPETPAKRMTEYLEHLPKGQGCTIGGRNVLPYESTAEFVACIAPFVAQQTQE